ncbi:MAG: tetratricopeptide repeat protein, partial [Verrucomicrobiota bacterium]|nr:tetratricopeptide repeat protein [Verrucomicrobiota bacterium]
VQDRACPDVPRASYFLGQSLVMIGKYDAAEKVLSEGLRVLPKSSAGSGLKVLAQGLERSLVAARRGQQINELDLLVRQKNWELALKASEALKGKAGAQTLRVSLYGALARYELKQFKELLPLLAELKKDAKGTSYEQESIFLLAEVLREQKRLPDALAEYEAAAKLPGSFKPEALFRSGLICYQQDDSLKAIGLLSELCKGYAEKIRVDQYEQAQIYLGISYYQIKNNQAARDLLSKIWAVEKHGFKPDAGYYLAWLNLNEKKLEASVDFFGQLSDGYPEHQLAADARLQQGMLLVNLGRFDNAQKALEKFITEHREDKRVDQVNYQLGLILMDQKLWQPASVKFSQVPKESAWRDEALYQLAWCEKRTARKPLAISYYKELLADYKDSPLINPATLELAELEFEGKEFDGAIGRLTKFIGSNPELPLKARAQYRLGWSFYEKKQYVKAAELFELALPGVPKNLAVVTAWQAGESQLRNKKFARASLHYKAVAKAEKSANTNLDRLQEQAWLRLGYSQAQDKKWADSGKTYAKFVENYPEHTEVRAAMKEMGVAHRHLQQYDEALRAFEKVVAGKARDELGAEAQFLRGECFLDQKKYDQAIGEYVDVAIYPFKEWQARALYELAVALERKGEPTKARDQFNQLISMYPDTQAAKLAKGQLK